MEIYLIIIVFALISVISAAAKNKKREEARRSEQGQQPTHSVPLSDIQKAFMLGQNPAPQQAPPPPAYAAPRPPYAPPQAAAYTPMQARTTDTMQARVSTSVPPQSMYTGPQDIYGGSMGAVTDEGRKDTEGEGLTIENARVFSVESVAGTGLKSITDIDRPVQPVRKAPAEQPVRNGLPIGLFDNKDEYFKAVIYSEILSRRSPGRTRRT